MHGRANDWIDILVLRPLNEWSTVVQDADVNLDHLLRGILVYINQYAKSSRQVY